MPSDSRVAKVMALTDRDPLQAIQEGRDLLGRETAVGMQAWLWGVLAQAYTLLDDSEAARLAALRGLKIAKSPQDPAHSHLLIILAQNSSKADEVMPLAAALETALRHHQRGTAIAVCIEAQLSDAMRLQNKPDAAVAALNSAFFSSQKLADPGPRLMVRSRLATLAGYQSDTEQALTLLHEQMIEHRQLGQSFLIGLLHRRIGLMLNRADRFDEALAQLQQAERTLKNKGTPLLLASVEVEACRALIGLERWRLAEKRCRHAQKVFDAHDSDLLTQAVSQLARIRLARGDPAGALNLFNSVLEPSGGKSASAASTAQLQWRAKAYAKLGRHDEAYRDLLEYMTSYKKWNDAAAKKQAAEFRAQIESDRQAARNLVLGVQLRETQAQSKTDRRSFESSRNAAVLALMLLSLVALALNWHRRRLGRVASTDDLTGLLNRRAAVAGADALLSLAEQNGQPISVALLDLDHFKVINDTHGHAGGDDVLRTFATATRAIVGGRGITGRWGGEEFLIVLPGLRSEAAKAVLEEVRATALTLSIKCNAKQRIHFSAGVAEHASPTERLDDLVARADEALYRAKRNGRGRTCVADHVT